MPTRLIGPSSMRNPGAAVLMFMIVVTSNAVGNESLDLSMLEGAWWDDQTAPTAAFAIHDSEVWIDYLSDYRPCSLDGDVLIFEIGPNMHVRHRIISLEGDEMVLEHLSTGRKWSLRRVERRL